MSPDVKREGIGVREAVRRIVLPGLVAGTALIGGVQGAQAGSSTLEDISSRREVGGIPVVYPSLEELLHQYGLTLKQVEVPEQQNPPVTPVPTREAVGQVLAEVFGPENVPPAVESELWRRVSLPSSDPANLEFDPNTFEFTDPRGRTWMPNMTDGNDMSSALLETVGGITLERDITLNLNLNPEDMLGRPDPIDRFQDVDLLSSQFAANFPGFEAALRERIPTANLPAGSIVNINFAVSDEDGEGEPVDEQTDFIAPYVSYRENGVRGNVMAFRAHTYPPLPDGGERVDFNVFIRPSLLSDYSPEEIIGVVIATGLVVAEMHIETPGQLTPRISAGDMYEISAALGTVESATPLVTLAVASESPQIANVPTPTTIPATPVGE